MQFVITSAFLIFFTFIIELYNIYWLYCSIYSLPKNIALITVESIFPLDLTPKDTDSP
jgi:hypothetical protein